ncbi:L-fuculose-phosphate aldolase [Sphingopyxis panaciterrae]|uniref:class II aldolase/adducin family protein n=1 Tax=Sphingopyxis panaciterrae TaxID=363841 RepID=UPI00141FBB9C|nr:class II aldolase/adducin family protein [Sphingopyxis panaciterrae]NIJ39702.1 L-fuculose-phosphate aldolase [Sphingopyxis panaciterrae]
MTEDEARQQLVDAMRALDARGLNRGTSGNLSLRFGAGMFVTPSGVTPDRLTPEAMVFVGGDGSVAAGAARPSSEWRMHMGLYRRRADANAIVHCHARHATILACAHREIPPLHYMVAVSGGASVPVAPYATFGSEELAAGVVETLDGRLACLMANHGLIALGPRLATAMAIAEEIEEQAAIYCGTLAIGGPKLLDPAEMERILGAFRQYGQRDDRD